MGKKNLAQMIHIVPLTAPVQASVTFTPKFINMKLYDKVEFIVEFGAIAGDAFVITANQSATAAGGTPTAIAATYRLTAAAATDTMGAVTALTTSGFTSINGTHEGMVLIIDIDSSDMTTESLPYAGLVITDNATADVFISVLALCWPKYPKETNSGALT
jgi:hypothetical protein